MYYGISLVNVGIVLLDVGLIWACLSVDAHLKFLDTDDHREDAESQRRNKRISQFMY